MSGHPSKSGSYPRIMTSLPVDDDDEEEEELEEEEEEEEEQVEDEEDDDQIIIMKQQQSSKKHSTNRKSATKSSTSSSSSSSSSSKSNRGSTNLQAVVSNRSSLQHRRSGATGNMKANNANASSNTNAAAAAANTSNNSQRRSSNQPISARTHQSNNNNEDEHDDTNNTNDDDDDDDIVSSSSSDSDDDVLLAKQLEREREEEARLIREKERRRQWWKEQEEEHNRRQSGSFGNNSENNNNNYTNRELQINNKSNNYNNNYNMSSGSSSGGSSGSGSGHSYATSSNNAFTNYTPRKSNLPTTTGAFSFTFSPRSSMQMGHTKNTSSRQSLDAHTLQTVIHEQELHEKPTYLEPLLVQVTAPVMKPFITYTPIPSQHQHNNIPLSNIHTGTGRKPAIVYQDVNIQTELPVSFFTFRNYYVSHITIKQLQSSSSSSSSSTGGGGKPSMCWRTVLHRFPLIGGPPASSSSTLSNISYSAVHTLPPSSSLPAHVSNAYRAAYALLAEEDPHVEDLAQAQWCISAEHFNSNFDPSCRSFRFVLYQYSPLWSSYELRALQAFTLIQPEIIDPSLQLIEQEQKQKEKERESLKAIFKLQPKHNAPSSAAAATTATSSTSVSSSANATASIARKQVDEILTTFQTIKKQHELQLKRKDIYGKAQTSSKQHARGAFDALQRLTLQ